MPASRRRLGRSSPWRASSGYADAPTTCELMPLRSRRMSR
ncbi:Uncharacterised protein [Bordetella pertussis]|nr:Uncharacterised protein [Bordetella pertussis]